MLLDQNYLSCDLLVHEAMLNLPITLLSCHALICSADCYFTAVIILNEFVMRNESHGEKNFLFPPG